MEEQRIYVAVAGTIKTAKGVVVQPPGRQIAQACHVVSKLRHTNLGPPYDVMSSFEPITTIILQARDSEELQHVFLLWNKRKLNPVLFMDNNPEYGTGEFTTAIAVFATPKQVIMTSDYLPLWTGK